ncbi:sugar transferase [Ramlibacter tataouinensis]|uniref:sugar transferase n=1 Tax=Ramlibacter tataouinensis TaxID=94132 RepID=UPI0022F3B33F|nr:sugar transferase [Ramlibacter tataouinensis]WBY00897.1 sugar transferase [Ramlibacter tataouinensis]
MKRALDIVLSLLALALLWPVLLLAALAVALDSGRPVLFRQQRVGLQGRLFTMLKFRSMVPDAPARGPAFTLSGDPRITRVGRFLRRTSIDELPQLLNVLRGDMSLVGPRPDLPSQAQDYRPEDWALRCRVRPGITGLAQATLRSQATPAQRLAADLAYARAPSLAADLRIVLMTLRRLGGAGAN